MFVARETKKNSERGTFSFWGSGSRLFWVLMASLAMSFFDLYATPTLQVGKCVTDASYAGLSATVTCLAVTPAALTLALMLLFTLFCFVASCINNNDSWVDRLWSLTPPVYAWAYALHPRRGQQPLWASGRAVMAVAVTIWGLRLTYNFYRKGGYQSGYEDHRWGVVRKWPVLRISIVWYVFRFFFICLYQNLVLWLIVRPLSFYPSKPFTAVDILVFIAFVGFVVLEAVADQQQWNFQNEKRNLHPRRTDVGDDYQLGFATHGVFAHSRHLNVWSEQQLWLLLTSGSMFYSRSLNASFLGAVVLVLLTVQSTRLTEKISASKYPKYRAYEAQVPMLVPRLRCDRKKLDEALHTS